MPNILLRFQNVKLALPTGPTCALANQFEIHEEEDPFCSGKVAFYGTYGFKGSQDPYLLAESATRYDLGWKKGVDVIVLLAHWLLL